MSYEKPKVQTREVTANVNDWTYLESLGEGDVQIGLRVALILARTLDGRHGLPRHTGETVAKALDAQAWVQRVERELSSLSHNNAVVITVSSYNTALFTGLAFHNQDGSLRCNVFLDPETALPHVAYGLASTFDEYTGHPGRRADVVSFKEQDPLTVANFVYRYFTDSIEKGNVYVSR